GTYRIFVLGESAAQGHPDPAYSFARCLEVLLQDRYPNSRFEVINTAMTAINSHVIRLIGKDCASRQGDLWVVYMRHNEVVGPFGPGTRFGPRTPSLGLIHAGLALKTTGVGQLLDAGLRRVGRHSSSESAWRGLEMFSELRLAAQDSHLAIMYRHFQSNL